MNIKRIRWRCSRGRAAVVETDRGFAVATDLGLQDVPAWRARLFLFAESLFRVLAAVRPL